MAYQVLARKWRPQNFSSLVGQEPIVTALRNAEEDAATLASRLSGDRKAKRANGNGNSNGNGHRSPKGNGKSVLSPREHQVVELLASGNTGEEVAERLGISRPSLYLLIEKFPSIRKAADLTRAEIQEAKDACGGDLDAAADRLEVSKKGLQQRMAQLGMG